MGNVLLNRPTNQSSYISPFTGSRAVNGNYTTPTSRWVGKVPGWMSVNAGFYAVVNRWVVRQMGGIAGWNSGTSYNMKNYSLQGSNDGANWVTLDSVTNNTLASTDRTFNPIAAFLMYRVNVSSGLNGNSGIASIVEFEAYDISPTSPLLSNLTISAGTLSPVFASGTYTYTASVPYSASSIVVTPTAQVPSIAGLNAQITVNGVAVASGAGTSVNLNVGSNTITVAVRGAYGGLTQNYTLTVTRANPSADLTSLSVKAGTTELITNFNKATTSYSANVGYDTTSVVVTPVPEASGATVTVNGQPLVGGSYTVSNLVVGANTITVHIDAGGGTTKDYTVTVTRAAAPANLYLSSVLLTFTGPGVSGTRTITMDHTNLNYSTTKTSSRANQVTVSPIAEDSTVTIIVNGNQTIPSGGTSSAIPLPSGTTISIPVKVSKSGVSETRDYTIAIS